MKLKKNPDNFMLQIGNFVYDYKYDNMQDKIVVAYAKNIQYYTIYNATGNHLMTEFTTMPNDMINMYMDDLCRNNQFIIMSGKEDLK